MKREIGWPVGPVEALTTALRGGIAGVFIDGFISSRTRFGSLVAGLVPSAREDILLVPFHDNE